MKKKTFEFGKTSRERLSTCHPDIQLIMTESLKVSLIDFGMAEGHRPVARQQKLYAQGRTEAGPIITYIDGINKKGKHNLQPSMAGDIYAWIGKASWDERYLCYLAGVIQAITERLYKEGKINHKIRWGGNWDGDGIIITDQSFVDLPHHELIKV